MGACYRFREPPEKIMRAIPRLYTPLANLAARVTNAGGFFAFAVAYVLFALMFLLMLADTILTIVRTW
jgi:hypothetical protein